MPRVFAVIVGAAIVGAVGLFVAGAAGASDAGPGDRRQHVVARVGPATITVGELEDRFAQVPAFQRAGLGATPAAARRQFLVEVMVHDDLLTAAAEEARLGETPPAAYQIERARSAATIRAIRARIGPAAAIPMQDVERYYDDNRARYDAPERYQLWRILCKTREEAQSVLEIAQREATPAKFADLARERSLDKATSLRGGNLGFVTAEGTSNEPGLRLDPAVVRAAQTVRDGAFVPQPVAEGSYFSVVWRRGTIPPSKRTVGDVAAQIRDILWKARVKKETDDLVASLRVAHVRDENASLLSTIDVPVDPPRRQ
jgi:peptidyl-prolyl cis-trans isomerase C